MHVLRTVRHSVVEQVNIVVIVSAKHLLKTRKQKYNNYCKARVIFVETDTVVCFCVYHFRSSCTLHT